MESIQWEHRWAILDLNEGGSIKSLGIDGWEAVGMCTSTSGQILIFFKRPIGWKKPERKS